MSISARKLQRAKHTTVAPPSTATMYLSPASGTYSVGDTVVVSIYENSGSTPVNAAQANLTYSAAQLQYVSASNSGSPFSTAIPPSGGGGSVQIAVAQLGGSSTGLQLVSTVTFTVIAAGAATITFAAGSAVARESDSTDILSGTTGSSYTCVATGATMSLSPASGIYSNGATIVVSIYENSGSTPVNAVQANLTYSAAQLQYVSASNSGSPFSTAIPPSGGGGSVQIAVAQLGGSSTGSQLVSTVTFTAVGTGPATVSFASGSAVARESDSTDILSGTTGSSYTIT